MTLDLENMLLEELELRNRRELIFVAWCSPNISPVPAGTRIDNTEEYNGNGWATSGGAIE